uniref:DUF659 domain-containing protein n=1 Tax=Amphimedon queenslandica TaxID=400682 RepID=A0A1X7TW25_AMPQE
MIALDYQPFSIVDDVGFNHFLQVLESWHKIASRKYFTKTILPNIYESTRQKTVISSRIMQFYTFKNLMAHTGEAIKEKFLNMFEILDISHKQIYIVLHDNATNIVKALNDASLPHYGCFTHSIQLVVHDGVLSQRAVINILARCRKIVGWNSSLYMLQRLQKEKMALAADASECSIDHLSANELHLMNKIINALSPIEKVTKSISADSASVSVIISFLRIIRKNLDDHHEDSEINTMKSEMKTSLEKRFAYVERNEKLTLATIFDPRFKNKFLSHPSVGNNVTSLVQAH